MTQKKQNFNCYFLSLTASTIFFTLIWLLNPSILSAFSVLGLTATICDYVVPMISRSLFKSNIWTDTEEKEFEDICTSIMLYKSKIGLTLDSYFRLRTSKPTMVIVCFFRVGCMSVKLCVLFLVLCSNYIWINNVRLVGECFQ